MLSKEELSLWEEYKANPGDVGKRNQLIEMYLPFVHLVANRLNTRLMKAELDVLIQGGVFGLMSAIENFDFGRGLLFETYSALRIRGAMLDEVRESDWIPRLVRSKAAKLKDAADRLLSTGQLSDDALKMALDLSEEAFEKFKAAARVVGMSSIDRTVFESEYGRRETVGDMIASNEDCPQVQAQKRDLQRLVLKGFNAAERLVVILYYYEGRTMRQVGQQLGLTESRISQIHSDIVRRLKERLKDRQDEFIP